jgi:hypothetical protein
MRLRQAALDALEEFGRPFSVHELEGWIASHDPQLCQEIAKKCCDYIRVILSLTPDHSLTKYRCNPSALDGDPRVSYFGAPNAGYDPTKWRPWAKTGKRHPGTKRRPQRKSSSISQAPTPPEREKWILFGGPVVKSFSADVDDRTCEAAWFALRTLVPNDQPFWGEIRKAMRTMRVKIEHGEDPENVLQRLLGENSMFTLSVFADDVAHILSMEAIRTQKEMHADGH